MKIRAGLLVALAVLVLAGRAEARTFQVTTTADTAPNGCANGSCTLREAVIGANARVGADVVELRSNRTYVLELPGTGEDLAATGDLDVTGPLTIQRSNRRRATIDGGGLDGVLDGFAAISLRGIQVRGGTTGIRTTGSVKLRGSVIAANTGYGIQTLAPGGPIKLTRSRISGNDFQGIQSGAPGEIILVRSSVSGNDFQGIQKNSGGGVTLDRSSVDDNAFQGLQQNDAGGVKLVRSTVSGNGFQGIQEYDGGDIALVRSSVNRNGFQAIQESDGGVVRLRRSRVSDNGFSGIQTNDTGGLRILRSTLARNGGTAVQVDDQGSATIGRARIIGSGSGSGLIAAGEGGVALSRSRIAGGSRGVLVGDGTDATIANSTIEDNAGDDGGAGVYVGTDADLVLRGSTIANNTTEGVSGGGILVNAGGSLRATNSTISGNRAFLSGGGIRVEGVDATASLNAVTVVRNIANYTNASSNSGGGGVNSTGGGTFAGVRNSLIARNQAAFGAFGPDCYTNLGSTGHNLLTNYAGCTGLLGSDDEIANPKIGALKRNGGPTKTVALKRGSPAIGEAGADAPNRDQRGRRRDRDPDIGAFER